MAALSIRAGITSVTPLADIPQEDWPILMRLRRKFCDQELPHDCRLLLTFIEDGRNGGFAGYVDEDAYIRDGLGLKPETAGWALKGLELLDDDGQPVPLEAAKTAGQTMVEAMPLAKHGEVGRGRDRGVVNTSSVQRGSTNAGYLAARIKRDRPDIAEAVVRGEYPSIRAAALAAGIVRRTVQVPLDPERAAAALRRHFSDDDLELIASLLRR